MEKSKLEKYIQQYYSLRKIAKAENCSVINVRYWLKKFGLKTIPQQYKPYKTKPKIYMEITEDYSNAMWLDYTEVTTPAKNKHSKKTGIKILTVYYNGKRLAYVLLHNTQEQTLIIVSNLVKLYKPSKVIADKEFYFLHEIIPIYRCAIWNCSRQLNEKYHGGLKVQVYPALRMLKKFLNISDEKLSKNLQLVYGVYLQVLRNNDYQIQSLIPTPILEKPISLISQ
jgi:hypothetical protein